MPPKAQANPIPLGLTARDTEIALVAWVCLEADNKVNAEKLATLTSINKPESASRMFRSIKSKIEKAIPAAASNANGGGASVQVNATKAGLNKKNGAGKKRAKRDVDTDDGAPRDTSPSDEGGTPKKAATKRTKPVKTEQPEADADVEGVDGDAEAGVA